MCGVRLVTVSTIPHAADPKWTRARQSPRPSDSLSLQSQFKCAERRMQRTDGKKADTRGAAGTEEGEEEGDGKGKQTNRQKK